MALFYSASINGFFDDTVHKSLPDDVVSITKERYEELLNHNYNESKQIKTNEEGLPHSVELDKKTITWDQIKLLRNALLQESDWTQLPDVPESVKSKWSEYRTKLRNVPQDFASPDLVIWPDPPK